MKKNTKGSGNPGSSGVDTNIWAPIVRGIVVIVLGVGGFLLLAVQAPLDAGVVADGTVTVSSNRKTIQHLSGGRVTDIFVKEGDQVKKNQYWQSPDPTHTARCRWLSRYSGRERQSLAAGAPGQSSRRRCPPVLQRQRQQHRR